jgi:hypothetical protein
MARRVRNSNLETRQARHKLAKRRHPYWTRLEEGRHLGYRRLSGAGKWVFRVYLGKDVRWVWRGKETEKHYQARVIGETDDFSDANGVSILSFDQAQEKARALNRQRVFHQAGVVDGPYTVRRAMDDYLEYLKNAGKSYKGTKSQIDAHILPVIGDVEVAELTSERLRRAGEESDHRPR